MPLSFSQQMLVFSCPTRLLQSGVSVNVQVAASAQTQAPGPAGLLYNEQEAARGCALPMCPPSTPKCLVKVY